NPSPPPPPPATPPAPPVWMGGGNTTYTSFPVSPVSGHKMERNTDIVVPVTGGPFRLSRTYVSDPELGGPDLVGRGWSMNVFRYLDASGLGGAQNLTGAVTINLPGSGTHNF